MTNTLFTVIKFVLALVLFPIVWATAVAFHRYVLVLPGSYGAFFFWGMFGYVLIYLFFFQFWGAYEFGQKIVSELLRFTAPANHFIAKIIPFYVTLILLLFYAVKHFLHIDHYDHYFMFFTGFTMTMHIVLTAQDLQENEKSFIKPAYLFTMVCALIAMAFFVVLLFNLVLKEFMLLEFFKSVWNNADDVYYLLVRKIFLLE